MSNIGFYFVGNFHCWLKSSLGFNIIDQESLIIVLVGCVPMLPPLVDQLEVLVNLVTVQQHGVPTQAAPEVGRFIN